MTPYRTPLFSRLGNLAGALFLVTVLLVNPAWAGPENAKPDLDALTHAGWEHFYSLEYDQAIRDFEMVLKARPDDPIAVNHLLCHIVNPAQPLHMGNPFQIRKPVGTKKIIDPGILITRTHDTLLKCLSIMRMEQG